MAQVRRRLVFLIEGYKPQEANGLYRMFRREWDRFCKTWTVQSNLSDCNTESDDIASWIIDTAGPNWQVTTRYKFLRLEHLIRANLAQPLWRQLGRRWMIDNIVSGALHRVFRTSWRMGVLLIYCRGMLRPIADGMFVNQFNNCWLYLREFARGAPTGFDRLLNVFAGRIVTAAHAREAHEILVVGHSAGAMPALTIVVRALERDPDIGRHGPKISIVTVGSIMPALALHPAAEALRGTVAKMVTERSVLWIDCQSREDFMNFWPLDPLAGIGVNAGERRCNPQTSRIPVRKMIAPKMFRRSGSIAGVCTINISSPMTAARLTITISSRKGQHPSRIGRRKMATHAGTSTPTEAIGHPK